jgi:hypothetical protein
LTQVSDPVSSQQQYGERKHGMKAAAGKKQERSGGDARKAAEASVIVGPPWLEALLTAEFFQPCALHGEASKHECNQFCVDCMGAAFCTSCVLPAHREHHVVQV